MGITDALENAKRLEAARRYDAGEAEVLAKLELPPPTELDNQTREDLAPFVKWTTEHNVRYAPAKPFVCAAFIIDQAATGATTSQLLRRVSAISALHDRHNLADPVATTAARYALEQAIPTEAPRSWNKTEKQAFVGLPPEIKAAIARREKEREKELRRLQNSTAEKRQATAPETTSKPVDLKEKEITSG
jgi:hypothetical protein